MGTNTKFLLLLLLSCLSLEVPAKAAHDPEGAKPEAGPQEQFQPRPSSSDNVLCDEDFLAKLGNSAKLLDSDSKDSPRRIIEDMVCRSGGAVNPIGPAGRGVAPCKVSQVKSRGDRKSIVLTQGEKGEKTIFDFKRTSSGGYYLVEKATGTKCTH